MKNLGEQGWRSGESARLPPLWPGFDSRTRGLLLEAPGNYRARVKLFCFPFQTGVSIVLKIIQ